MTIKDMKELRTKLLLDAQNILLANPDAEKRTSANKMLTEADTLESDITALEKIEVEQRKTTAPARETPGLPANTETETRASEKKAFENYIRYGVVSPELRSNMEARTVPGLISTTAAQGGQFVPQGFYPVLVDAMKSYGQVLNLVKQIDVDNGAPTKYATIDDTGNLMSVVGENVAVSEVDPTTISGNIISSDFLTTGVILVSLAELQDSAFNLDAWIKEAFGKRYFRGLASMVTSASSSGNIGSIVTGAVLGATATGAAGTTGQSAATVSYHDMVTLFGALDPAYETNAVWSFNTATRALLLGTTDSLGRPLYIPAPTADKFDMILGKQVCINTFMADPVQAVTDKYPVLYGDHSAYLLRNVKPGLSVMRLNERYMDQGAVGFIGFARAGGAVLNAGTNPLLKMKIAHS